MMMDEDKERWSAIEGYEGYEISTKGRVRSYWKRNGLGHKKGFCYEISNEPHKNLNWCIDSHGYIQVNIKNKRILVHRLLAITFIPNPHKYPLVDHIDRNPLNISLSNLRWCSRQQNNLNSKLRKDNQHGTKGLLFRHNKWYYHYSSNGKLCWSSQFDTKEEAKEYRNKMVEEHYDKNFYTS